MLKILILGILFGMVIVKLIDEVIYVLRAKKINRCLSKTLIDLLEVSTMRIGERENILKRELTEEEKDKVIDDFYKEYKEQRARVV